MDHDNGAGLNHPRLNSVGEFFRDLFEVIKIALSKRKNLSRLDPILRETICLTVTLSNNCRL